MDAQWSLFISKSQTFGLGHTTWADTFGAFWVFSADLSAPISPKKRFPKAHNT